MSNKNLWVVIGAVAVIVLVAGIVYWRSQKSAEEDTLLQEQQAVQNLQQAVDQTAPTLDVPRINPLGESVPDVNPLEKANPFRTKNPFK